MSEDYVKEKWRLERFREELSGILFITTLNHFSPGKALRNTWLLKVAEYLKIWERILLKRTINERGLSTYKDWNIAFHIWRTKVTGKQEDGSDFHKRVVTCKSFHCNIQLDRYYRLIRNDKKTDLFWSTGARKGVKEQNK